METELPDFGRKSDDDKLEDFARSSCKLVLKQIGVSATPPGDWATWDWFNEQAFIKPYVTSTRCSTFDIVDVLFRPTRSALLKELNRVCLGTVPQDVEGYIIIFKVYEWGRFVATNLPCDDRTHFHVVSPPRGSDHLSILPMLDFFTQWNENRNG